MKSSFSEVAASWFKQAAVGMGMLALAAGAHADDYPNKPIKIVCAFPAGNAADIIARVMAEQLSPRLGQPVVVENKAGASGTIAASAVLQAPADGYTLLMTSTSFAINSAVLKSVPYNLESDFIPISMVSSVPAILIVNRSFPANTFAEMLDLMKRNPGKYTYGHPGAGTMQNMTMKLFSRSFGVDVLEVPYKGSVQAVTDIVGGSLDMMFESGNSAAAFVKSGKVKAIATSGPTRYYGLPEVPTVGEAGNDFKVLGWIALVAPAKMPAPIVERLNKEVVALLQEPAVAEKMRGLGFDVYPQKSPAEFKAQLLGEERQWNAIALSAGISKE